MLTLRMLRLLAEVADNPGRPPWGPDYPSAHGHTYRALERRVLIMWDREPRRGVRVPILTLEGYGRLAGAEDAFRLSGYTSWRHCP